MITLGELAERYSLTLSGGDDIPITGLASLANAGAGELSFLSRAAFLPQLRQTRASAVLLHPDYADHCPVPHLKTTSPELVMASISALFAPQPPSPTRHPSAVIDPTAEVDMTATVGPHVVIEADAVIAAGVVLSAGVVVGAGARIDAESRLYPHVVVYHGVVVGKRCRIHSHAVLGADGFGFVSDAQERWQKVHQLGSVCIGDDVEIGAGSTVDRGSLDDTVIANGVIIDDQVHIAHNCRIGANTAIAGCVGIAGSTVIGANCQLGGGVGVLGHLSLCDGVRVTAMSMVTGSIDEPGTYSSGTRLAPTAEWRRSAVRFSQLESLHRRVRDLERASPQVGMVRDDD